MRALIEFDGGVSARIGSGAVGLSLRGEAAVAAPLPPAAAVRAAPEQRALELLFSGTAAIAPAIPPSLHAVRVIELDAGSSSAPPATQPPARDQRLFRIEASEGQYLVRARSVQLHAAASGAFCSVLPRTRLAPVTRWGWSLLLSLLRLLPVACLTGRRRA